MIDITTEFGRRVERRLREERIIWLTTVGMDGTPQPRPVWFLWNGDRIIIFSKPGTHKIKHIRRNKNVALHFDSDGLGGNIIVLTGEAEIAEDEKPASEHAAYVEKYQKGFERINMTPSEFARSYSVAIRVKPNDVRGH